jgi:EmrB/QacA subfamily drug resistance transporter
VVTATLLASTATTPIWGKLADLFSKKLLVQLSITIFTVGSILAGFSQSVETLIGWRVLQGIGLGGLQALIMIVMAAMISPRERGRYTGLISTVMSVAPVAGPLIGGVIVDTEWLGWRWCFWVGAPLAVVALVVVQRTLNLPVVKRKVSIDYLGAALVAAGVSALLIWVTLAGNTFAWGSTESLALAGLGAVLIAAFLVVESRAKEPIIPLRLFRDRTTTLSILASIAVGVAMFGGAVFLGQYFQIARGFSPTTAGLLTLPMIVGSMISSTGSGALITRYGKWKIYLVIGAVFMLAAFGLLSTIDHTTNLVLVGIYLFLLGFGMGMAMQNLVLAVQNSVSGADLGAASSTVTFFRSMGGTIGVSVLGAVLASRVAELTTAGLATSGETAPAGGAAIGNLNELPTAIADIVRAAYGDATAQVFMIAGLLAIITFVAVLAIREIPLRTETGMERERIEAQTGADGARVNGAPYDRDGDRTAEGEGRHAALADQTPAIERPSPAPPVPGVHGAVSRGDGAVLDGAVVTVTDQNGRQEGGATTGCDGGYRVPLPAGGTYLVVASSGALDPHAALVTVGGQPVRHDIVLSGSSGVRGLVTSAAAVADGLPEPAPGATVTLIDEHGAVAGATRSDGRGRYRLPGVPEGRYTLAASAPGHPPAALSVRLHQGHETERDIALPGRATLRGTVVAVDGVIDRAVASLVDTDGTVVASVVTGPDGTFEFDDLPAGTYTLTARTHEPVEQVVHVSAGTAATALVELVAPSVDAEQVRR